LVRKHFFEKIDYQKTIYISEVKIMADEKEYVKIEDVDSAEKMKDFVDNTNLFIEKQKETIETQAKELEDAKAERARIITDLDGVIQINKKDWSKDESDEGDLYRFGMFLSALQHNDRKTLVELGASTVKNMNKNQPVVEKATSGVGSPLTGDGQGTATAQYLVPQIIYSPNIMRTMMLQSEIIPKFTHMPMTGRLVKIPAELTQSSFTHVTNEVTDKTESAPTYTYVDLTAETYAFWVAVTEEFMDDTMVDMAALIRSYAVEALQTLIEGQICNGSTGATGIMQESGCTDSVIDSSSIEDITWDDLHDMIALLTTGKKRAGAAFIMHPTIWDRLRMLQDGVGRYFFDLQQEIRRSAFGYPVYLTDNTPALTDDAASTAFVIFGNPKYALWGTLLGMEMRYFDQTYYTMLVDENFFRCRVRQAYDVGLPGNFVLLKTNA